MLSSLPPAKGVSPYTSHLIEALSKRSDVRLEVLCFASIYPSWLYPGGDPEDGGETPSFDGVRVRRLLTWYNPLSWIWAGLTLQGSVVHAQWWSYFLTPVYTVVLGIARLRGKRVLLTVHNVEPHEKTSKIRSLLNRLVFRFADSYIVHSQQNRETLEGLRAARGKPVAVVPHGALRGPSAGLDASSARRLLGLPADAKVTLAFGNIRPYKGVDTLLKAFGLVVEACPESRLVIAGQPWCDWAPYQKLIDDLGLEDHVVTHLRYIPDDEVEAFFRAADVVALPYTHFDAQSSVAALTLSYGRPAVVSRVGGLPDLIDAEECVVPPSDPASLAAALLYILSDDCARRRLEERAVRRARELDWGPIAAQTSDYYRHLLKRSS